jgi:hypothetical protein
MEIGLPDEKGRLQILNVHTAKVLLLVFILDEKQ